MSRTYQAAFCFENLADAATITASGSLPLCPPSMLQDQDPGNRWCVESDTAYLTFALGASYTIDFIGLYGLNLNSTAITRVRASLTDPSAVAGDAYDSGSAAGRVSAYYGALATLTPASIIAAYVRIDLSQAAATRIMAGFAMVGAIHQVAINYGFGAGDTPNDPSIITRARMQSVHIDPRPKRRLWNVNFEWVDETTRFGWVEDLDQLCGVSQNVVLIRNCTSTNLGRDALLGLVSKGSPTVSRDGFIDGAPAYSKAYDIEERNAPTDS